jgi:hypothetical protein
VNSLPGKRLFKLFYTLNIIDLHCFSGLIFISNAAALSRGVIGYWPICKGQLTSPSLQKVNLMPDPCLLNTITILRFFLNQGLLMCLAHGPSVINHNLTFKSVNPL